MKIWILNHYAIPPDRAGGTRHFDLAKEWEKRGHKTTIIAANFDYMMRTATAQASKQCTNSIINGIEFVQITTRPYYKNDWRRFMSMVDYGVNAFRCLHKAPPPDVIIGSMVHHFAVVSAYTLAKRFHVPFLLEIRDIWPDTLIDMRVFSQHHPFVLMLRFINKFLFPRASYIISVPPFASDRLQQYGAPQDRIAVIPNFVNVERFSPFLPPSPTKPFVVMYVGLHGPSNGLDTVVRAAKIVEQQVKGNVVFRLIGDGPAKESLQKLTAQIKVHNVEFHDPIPKHQLLSVMQNAHAFIFHLKDLPVLTKHGISPNKLLDYMAVGRPVIFACKSKNDPVREAGAGLSIPPENPEEMAKAVLTLAATPYDQLIQMGEAARLYIQRFYSSESAAEKYLRIIYKVTQR